jgi:HK97 family phage portal protein
LTGKAAPVQIGQPFATYKLINGSFAGTADNRESYITNGYNINDQLYSIVNLILDKIRMPEWGTYKIVDDESMKRYKSLMRKKNLTGDDFKEANYLKTKSLEPVNAGKITELLKYPNEYESFQDFVHKLIGYKLLTGEFYQWCSTLDMGANKGKPFEFHVLPSHEITILAQKDKFPITEVGYQLNTMGVNFSKEQVIHGKYANFDFDVSGGHLYGMSPVKAALKRVTRINSALTASGAMYQNQGVKGVLYVDDPRVMQETAEFTGKQVRAVKDKLVSGEWAGPEAFGKIGTSGYKMGWTEIGLSPVDLNIIESEKWDYIALCNIYGVPPELLGLTAKTYNNMQEAEKSLTSRVAMPQLVSYRDNLNRWLNQGAYKGEGLFIDFDQTCFTELQEDTKEKWSWVKELPISPNEKLELLGLETIDNPLFDEPWVKTEDGMPLSEWNGGSTDGGMDAGDGGLSQNE